MVCGMRVRFYCGIRIDPRYPIPRPHNLCSRVEVERTNLQRAAVVVGRGVNRLGAKVAVVKRIEAGGRRRSRGSSISLTLRS